MYVNSCSKVGYTADVNFVIKVKPFRYMNNDYFFKEECTF